jgi:hypothetical protein
MKKAGLALLMVVLLVSVAHGQIKMTIVDSENQPIIQGTLWTMSVNCVSMTGQVMLKETKADLLKGLCPTCPPGGTATATINGITQAISSITISTVVVSGPPIPPPVTMYSCSNGACLANVNGTYSSLAACQASCMVNPNDPCTTTPVVQPTGAFPSFFTGPKPNTKDGLVQYLKAVAPVDTRACPWLVWAQQSQANLDWVWAQTGYKLKRWYQAPAGGWK